MKKDNPAGGLHPSILPVVGVGGAAFLMALTVWACRPLDTPFVRIPEVASRGVEPEQIRRAVLDLDAFRTPIWVSPPSPPVPAVPVPVPARPPFKLQLIAITQEDGKDHALLYDPDRDVLLRVIEGQTLAEATVVERITAAGVDVRDGPVVRSLTLRETGKGGTP